MAHTTYFSVVSIAVLLLLIQTYAAKSAAVEEVGSRKIRDASHLVNDHGHGLVEIENFVTIGNYLLEKELSTERISRDFDNNHDGVFLVSHVESLLSSLFSRIGCEQRVENCSKCVSDCTSSLFAALQINENDGLTEEGLFEASPVLLSILFRLEPVCAAADAAQRGRNFEEGVVFANLMSAGDDGANATLTEEDLAEILHVIGENYTSTTQASCFDVESVFAESVSDHEAGANASETHAVAESVVAGLLLGHCIGEATLPTTEAFTDAVFDTYASGSVILEEEFNVMLASLGIGSMAGDPAHSDHAHRRRRDVHAATGSGIGLTRRREKRVVDAHGHDHAPGVGVPNISATCFTGEQLLDIHGVDHEAGISEEQFSRLAPSMVQQIISGACSVTEVYTPSATIPAEVWGYGTIAVFIISLLAVVGALFIPCMSGFTYEVFIQTLIALAVATLTGDAILHLIPQAVGLHAHDVTTIDVHTAHGPTNPELDFVWKCLVVEMAIYAFFLLESLSSFMTCGAHTHSHGGAQVEMSEPDLAKQNSARVYKSKVRADATESQLDLTGEKEDAEKRGFWTGFTPVALMIVVGDSLHNFGDGLAIGASFATGLAPGISTSIAVLCHELPHEFGDLAVLLNQGMSLRSAICLNFMSACTAFIGLWIGIPVSQNQVVRQWIFAATAGIFLYVGLVSMLPQLHTYRGPRRLTVFVFQNVGFLIGAAVILIIALYEDAITISV